MRKLGALAGAAIIVLMAGCSAGEESIPPVKFVPATADPSPRPEPSPTATPGPVADPAIMATMTCEPVSRDALSTLAYGPDATRAIQVEVGEGLEPGSAWWVVVMDLPHDKHHGWPPRRVQFLTDAPATSGTGKWITIDERNPGQDFSEANSGNPWANVKWDSERLIRAQSALVKAQGCLDA